jgi:hypothetical protein
MNQGDRDILLASPPPGVYAESSPPPAVYAESPEEEEAASPGYEISPSSPEVKMLRKVPCINKQCCGSEIRDPVLF